jgi:hypothetical protein
MMGVVVGVVPLWYICNVSEWVGAGLAFGKATSLYFGVGLYINIVCIYLDCLKLLFKEFVWPR